MFFFFVKHFTVLKDCAIYTHVLDPFLRSGGKIGSNMITSSMVELNQQKDYNDYNLIVLMKTIGDSTVKTIELRMLNEHVNAYDEKNADGENLGSLNHMIKYQKFKTYTIE
jgi:hypothetical protein